MEDPTSAASESKSVGPRLAPVERRGHLLGVARSIVEEQGVAALSMEAVAEAAGVSRALLYTYFDNRPGLIRALWDEVSDLWDVEAMPAHEELLGSSTLRELFDERLESNTRWYLDQIERNGLLFHRLQSEPVLASTVEGLRKRVVTDDVAWCARLVEAMGVDAERALVFSSLITSTSQVMWGLVARGAARREVIEDVYFLTCRSALDQLLADCRCDDQR